MKNTFNLRPIFFGAVSLILGIVLTTNYFLSKTTFNLVLLCLFLILILFLVVALIVVKFKNKMLFSKYFVSIIFIVVFAAFGVGAGVLKTYENDNIFSGELNVVGTVEDVKKYDNNFVINVSNLKFNDVSVNGKLELTLFLYDSNLNLVSGAKINCVVDVLKVDKNFDNINYIVNNINYISTGNLEDVSIENSNYILKDKIKNSVKTQLKRFLNSDNASIAYSVLFGEKENMSANTYEIFSYSGLAHILAVSGLHIGFLVAMLVALFKILKLNKHLSNLLIFIILLFYAYLCNFTPSVVRAMIMSMILLLSKSYGKQYDALNSLSISAIIVLLINLLNIYAVGFQLSYLCVLSIICLNKPITNALLKIKLPKVFVNSLAITLSVNLGILTVTASQFNEINFISVFSNIIVLPIFSVCFSLLFSICFLGLIFPFINYLLVVPNVILHFVKLFANYFSEINFLHFDLFNLNYLIVGLSIFLIYFIGFALTKGSVKAITSGCVILIIIVSTLILNIPKNFNNYFATSSYTSSGNYLFVATNNNKRILVLNGVDNVENVCLELNKNKVAQINYLVVNNYSLKDENLVQELCEKYDIEKLFVKSYFKDDILTNLSKYVFVNFVENDVFNVSNIEIKFYELYENNFAIGINFNNTNCLLINDTATKTELVNLSYETNTYDYIFTNKSYNLNEIGFNAKYFVTNKNLNFGENIIYLFNK